MILFNEDCRIGMERIQSDSVDLIISDPPYRVTARGGAGNSGGMLKKKTVQRGKMFGENNIECSEYAPELFRVLKEGGHCYIMTNHLNLIKMLNTFTSCGFHFIKSLIWDKQNKIVGLYYMSQFEYVLFFRKGKGNKINCCGTSDILSIPNRKTKGDFNENLHDTEKPVELMRVLVENSSNKGDTVLDPFAGIGSTAIACIDTGRDFIGFEIDKSYYEIAQKRIDERRAGFERVKPL